MFGALKPSLCQLPSQEKQAWRELYCGGCQALGEGYGQLSRLTLSYDQTLFAALIEALQAEPSEGSSCRCPAAPWLHRATLAPESPAMEVSAALHLLLVDQWLYDQSLDRSQLWGWLRALIGSGRARASERLSETIKRGAQEAQEAQETQEKLLGALLSFSDRQAKVEAKLNVSPERAAAPTSALLGALMSELITPLAASPTPELKAQLLTLGEALGEVIYLIDALEDLEGDAEKGRFNPCLISRGGERSPSRERLAWVEARLQSQHERLSALLPQLPLKRHKALLQHLLVQLGRRVHEVMEAHRARAQERAHLMTLSAFDRSVLMWRALGRRLGRLWRAVWGRRAARRSRRCQTHQGLLNAQGASLSAVSACSSVHLRSEDGSNLDDEHSNEERPEADEHACQRRCCESCCDDCCSCDGGCGDCCAGADCSC